MAAPTAFLIDVYETILTCDFSAHAVELPALAGVDTRLWNETFMPLGPSLTDGRMTVAQAFATVLERCGRQPTDDLVQALVERDRELLVRWSQLFEDTVPFLELLREKGVRVALVSNCSDTTRALLEHLQVDRLVDAMVLSCEVGWAKPASEIFKRALQDIEADPAECVFVDDQARFCAGALALGVPTVQIARGAHPDEQGQLVAQGATLARSFAELEGLL